MPHFSKEDKEKIQYLKKIIDNLLSQNHNISKNDLISVFEKKGWDKPIIKEVFKGFDKKQKKLVKKDRIEQRKKEKEEKKERNKPKKKEDEEEVEKNNNNNLTDNSSNNNNNNNAESNKKEQKETKKRLKEEQRLEKQKKREEKKQEKLAKKEQKKQQREEKKKIKVEKKQELQKKPSKLSLFINLFNKEVEDTKNHESIILLIITVLGYGFALNQSIFLNITEFIRNEAIRRYVVAPYLFVMLLIIGFVLVIETLRKLIQR